MDTLEAKGAEVSITWIAGHTGLTGNELADSEAKKGALEAKSLGTADSLSVNEAKKEIHQAILTAWQRQ